MQASPQAQLGNEPDGRKAMIPLIHPIAAIYLALVFGIVITSVLTMIQGASQRRVSVVAWGLLTGTVGFVVPVVVLYGVAAAEGSGSMVWLLSDLLSVLLGVQLYRVLRPHTRGHEHLQGPMLPLEQVVVGAMILSFFVPGAVLAWLRMPAVQLVVLGAA